MEIELGALYRDSTGFEGIATGKVARIEGRWVSLDELSPEDLVRYKGAPVKVRLSGPFEVLRDANRLEPVESPGA